jgi:hypothetical protein
MVVLYSEIAAVSFRVTVPLADEGYRWASLGLNAFEMVLPANPTLLGFINRKIIIIKSASTSRKEPTGTRYYGRRLLLRQRLHKPIRTIEMWRHTVCLLPA